MKKIINIYFIIIGLIVVLSIPSILAALNNEKFFYSDPVIYFGLAEVDENDNFSQKVQSEEDPNPANPIRFNGTLDFEIEIRKDEFEAYKESDSKRDFLSIYVVRKEDSNNNYDHYLKPTYSPEEFKEYKDFYEISLDFTENISIDLHKLGIYKDGVIKDDLLSLVFEFRTVFVKKGILIERNQITTTKKIIDFRIEKAGNRLVFEIEGSREIQSDVVYTDTIYKILYRKWDEFLNNSWEVKNE